MLGRSTTLRLVGFEEPVWGTIQGEGVLCGVPSVFIRLYGCDYSCSWCDTKGSWLPAFADRTHEQDVSVVRARVQSFGYQHLVITGGNPYLQAEQLVELLEQLPEHHVTVETQGSVVSNKLTSYADLVSLSPKLHQWPEHFGEFLAYAQSAQVKIVVSNIAEAGEALRRFEEIDRVKWPCDPHFILQPEASLGRRGVEMVRSTLEDWIRQQQDRETYPLIRIIPQLHKTALFVR